MAEDLESQKRMESSRTQCPALTVSASTSRTPLWQEPVKPKPKASARYSGPFLFLLCVGVSGIQPILYEAALWNPTTRSKLPTFVPHSVYMATFFIDIGLGNTFAACLRGYKGLQACWNIRQIAVLLPLAICFSFAETLDMYALKYVTADLKATVGRIQLPANAALRALFLKQPLTPLSFLAIVGCMCALTGYCFRKAQMVTGRSVQSYNNGLVVGLCLTLANAGLTTGGALLSEIFFKRKELRFPVQIAQLRVGAFLTSTALYVIHCHYHALPCYLIFQGWNRYVVFLVLWSVLKDWVSGSLIKHLDSLWRALAGILAMCLTNAVELLVLKESFDASLIAFIALLVVHVLTYAFCRREDRPQ